MESRLLYINYCNSAASQLYSVFSERWEMWSDISLSYQKTRVTHTTLEPRSSFKRLISWYGNDMGECKVKWANKVYKIEYIFGSSTNVM